MLGLKIIVLLNTLLLIVLFVKTWGVSTNRYRRFLSTLFSTKEKRKNLGHGGNIVIKPGRRDPAIPGSLPGAVLVFDADDKLILFLDEQGVIVCPTPLAVRRFTDENGDERFVRISNVRGA